MDGEERDKALGAVLHDAGAPSRGAAAAPLGGPIPAAEAWVAEKKGRNGEENRGAEESGER